MWVFLPGVFLSIVQHRERPQILIVRARRRKDLERVLEGLAAIDGSPAAMSDQLYARILEALSAPIVELEDADYRFRLELHRDVVAALMVREVGRIDYDNFKAHRLNRARDGMLMRVWLTVRSWALNEPVLFDEEETAVLLERGRRR